MTTKKKVHKQARNWALVVIAVTVMIVNVALLVAAVLYWSALGWWSLAVAVGALTSIFFSIQAIRKNEPAWLLLDLILPG